MKNQSKPNKLKSRRLSRREFLSESAGVAAVLRSNTPVLASATEGRALAGTGNASPVTIPEPATPQDIESLQHAFEHPPDDCRIMMRWWWFGPCATQAEIEREIQTMKRGGIGGFEVNPVYPLMLDDPDRGFRNYLYSSDEHLQALGFASAKARELGMRMDLTLGSGWPFGAANVPVTEAAGMIRIEALAVKPGVDRVAVPATSAGERLIAVFLAPGYPQNVAAGKAQQVTAIENETVRVPRDLDGPHALVFFISSRTGQQVKRAALAAEGFVLDHYDRTAVEHYLASVGDRLMQAFGSNPPRAVFCDSLEVYGSNWTADFMDEFRKRRGYDLTPYLPALAGDIGEKTMAIRHDWGATLTELFNENFVLPMQKWSRQRNTLFRAQLYGIPSALLSSYGAIDLPEGEGAHWKSFAPTRWASSAGHLYGRPVISSETWTWLHSPAFRATPLDMKAEADVHFLEGINQLVGHGWPYSPPEAGEPGWRFYAAAALNAHNPWWGVMPDITLYLARVSFMLRQGMPVNPVAIYLPTDDAWARFVPGKISNLESGNASVSETIEFLLGTHLTSKVLEAGYGFDFIDDAVIGFTKVESGVLAVNENRYVIVILPAIERIPVGTLKKLAQFAGQGGIVIATRRKPSLAPGLPHREEECKQIREISSGLFEGAGAAGHFVTDENLQLAKILTSLHPPDVIFSPPAPDLGFVRRRSAFAEFYFLANTANAPHQTQATLRVESEAENAEWWDPFTGNVEPAKLLGRDKGTATVALDLEPYGSRILVFSSRRPAVSTGDSRLSGAVDRPAPPEPLDLSTGWTVTFAKSSRPVPMDHLHSWTEDSETRFYSGEATYEKTVAMPEGLLGAGREVVLDFGEGKPVPEKALRTPGMRAWFEGPVREAAVVYVNGERAGSVWHPPYSLPIRRFLRPGENTLKIIVGNLAINRMAGQSLPDYRLLNLRYGERATPQDMQNLEPLPSGLLGPIRLIVR